MKKIFITAVALLVATSFLPSTANAALQGWDLVDSGKHLDWDHNTKYLSDVEASVKTWENYKKGVIRRDSISKLQDVYISDYSIDNGVLGVTYSNGKIQLNNFYFKDMTSSQRRKTITHELGHALGLDHTWGSSDIMQQGKLSITSLSTADKKSYDEAYRTY